MYVHTRTQVVLYDIHVLRVQFCPVSISPRCIIISYTPVKIQDFREPANHPGFSGIIPEIKVPVSRFFFSKILDFDWHIIYIYIYIICMYYIFIARIGIELASVPGLPVPMAQGRYDKLPPTRHAARSLIACLTYHVYAYIVCIT